jgi:hypothetical protein
LPGLTRQSIVVKPSNFWMDARVIYAKTRFALLPGMTESGNHTHDN